MNDLTIYEIAKQRHADLLAGARHRRQVRRLLRRRGGVWPRARWRLRWFFGDGPSEQTEPNCRDRRTRSQRPSAKPLPADDMSR
jgi:hypothetical protein